MTIKLNGYTNATNGLRDGDLISSGDGLKPLIGKANIEGVSDPIPFALRIDSEMQTLQLDPARSRWGGYRFYSNNSNSSEDAYKVFNNVSQLNDNAGWHPWDLGVVLEASIESPGKISIIGVVISVPKRTANFKCNIKSYGGAIVVDKVDLICDGNPLTLMFDKKYESQSFTFDFKEGYSLTVDKIQLITGVDQIPPITSSTIKAVGDTAKCWAFAERTEAGIAGVFTEFGAPLVIKKVSNDVLTDKNLCMFAKCKALPGENMLTDASTKINVSCE